MTSLIDRLRHDYPQFVFHPGQTAHWAPDSQTIYYDRDDLTTLHELGHALLGHDTYHQDAELLQIERQAWLKAQQIAPRYGLSISNEVIERALDSVICAEAVESVVNLLCGFLRLNGRIV